MDAPPWPLSIGVVRAVENTRPVEKKPRPQREEALNCPRCNSTNTKFCYYNNYSLSQPRYFCKTCRRYWTHGGTLRNIPVGGGSRKKQRFSSSSSSISPNKVLTNLNPPKFSPQNLNIHDGHHLNLGSNPPIYNGIPELVALPFALQTQNPNFSSSNLPFMELLKSAGNYTSGGLINSVISSSPDPNSNPVFSSSFPIHDAFKPRLNFSMDGLENGADGNVQSSVENHATSSRIVFPFEESKPVSNCELGHDRGQQEVDSSGYWNRMLPGGSW